MGPGKTSSILGPRGANSPIEGPNPGAPNG
jgi:hypothetical protein